MIRINERFYGSGAVFLVVIIMMSATFGGVYFWFNTSLQEQKNEHTATNKILQNKIAELQKQLEVEADSRIRMIFTDTAEKNTETMRLDYKFENNNTALNKQSVFISLKDGKIIPLGEKTKQRLALGKETVTALYAPLFKPDNQSAAFISTTKSITTTTSLNRIYLYNFKNGNLTEIYKETSGRLLRSAGFYKNKLIILVEDKKQAAAACFSPWSEWNQFVSLNISNTYATPESFQLPADKIEEGRAELSACLKEKGD